MRTKSLSDPLKKMMLVFGNVSNLRADRKGEKQLRYVKSSSLMI